MTIGVAAAGIVSQILVQEGSHVSAGQTLATLDCRPLEAEVRAREGRLTAAQAISDRVRNGSRPDEIAVGEAVVGDSAARAEGAKKTLDRTAALQEGVTVSSARVLEVERDARITAAQLDEARARLSLLKAGSREEDIRQTHASRDAAAADLDGARAQLDQCTIRAPANGTVLDVMATIGQFFSSAVPQPLVHIVPDGPPRVRAEVALRDAPHVCVGQDATVAAAGETNGSFAAKVAAISPGAVQRSLSSTPADAQEIVPVVLTIVAGGRPPPIGAGVSVRFDPCSPKT